MAEENISQEFRVKNMDKTRNYLIEEINWNELMRKNHKTFCTTLKYIERILVLASSIAECISVSAFAYFTGIPIEITSSAIRLKICAIAAIIKKSKPIIKKKKNKHDKIVLLAKSILNSIGVLIPMALIDFVISHDELF